MTKEELRNKIHNESLLPLVLTINPLQSVLEEILDLIEKQGTEIQNLKDDVATRAKQEDLDNLANTVDNNKKDADSQLENLKKELDEKAENLQNQINENQEQNDLKHLQTNNRIDENDAKLQDLDKQINDLKSQIEDFNNKINDHEERIKNLENQSRDSNQNNDTNQANDRNISDSNQNSNDGQNGDGSGNGADGSSGSGSSVTPDDLEALKRMINRNSDRISALENKGDSGARDGSDGAGERGYSGPDGAGASDSRYGADSGRDGGDGRGDGANADATDRSFPGGGSGRDGDDALANDVNNLKRRMGAAEDAIAALERQLKNIPSNGAHGADGSNVPSREPSQDPSRSNGRGRKPFEPVNGDGSDGRGASGSGLNGDGRNGDGSDGNGFGNDGRGSGNDGESGAGGAGTGSNGRGSTTINKHILGHDGRDGQDAGRDGQGGDGDGANGAGGSGEGADGSGSNGLNGEGMPIRPPSGGSGRQSSRPHSGTSMPLPDLNSPDVNEALQQLRNELTKLQQQTQDNTDDIKRLARELADRPDRQFIERLFEKFKSSLNGVVDMMENKDKGNGQYATMDDIKKLETLIKQITQEFDEAAASRKCVKCLSCGMGYRTTTGSIQDPETASILGAAPIQAVAQDSTNKPTFVYGSDHELYYSSSPRGKPFVASGRKPSPPPSQK